MLARGREVKLLRGTWDRVAELRQPHLLSLLGEAGIGKTRLCHEFVRLVEHGGGRVLRGRSEPYGHRAVYDSFAQMIRSVAGIAEAEARSEARAKLERHLQELIAGDPQPTLSHLFLIAGLAEESVDDRAGLFASAGNFIEALARERATLFVFEDVHWADPSLLDLIDWVAAHVREIPALFLTVGRPEFLDARDRSGGRGPRRISVSLDPLPGQASRAIALRRLGDSPGSAAAAERIEQMAGGNPLFAEELAAAIAEGAAGPADRLPDAIRGIIAARLDALPADQRELLLDASVAGNPFSRRALECLGPGDRDLTQALEELEFRDLVRRCPGSPPYEAEEFSFKHALIREVAYETLPRAARRERHATVARSLEEAPDSGNGAASLLAHHWRAAGASERALPYLLSAAEEADRGWACEEALGLYKQALELVPEGDTERRRELQLKQAVAYTRFTHLMGGDGPQLEAQADAALGPDLSSVSPGNPQV